MLAIGIPSLLFALDNWRKRQPIETKEGLWWGLYLGLLVLDMELFSKGQPLELTNLAHLAVLAGMALLVLPIAVHQRSSGGFTPCAHALRKRSTTSWLSSDNGNFVLIN